MTFIVPAVLGGLAITVMALVSIAASRKGKQQAAVQQQSASAQHRILIHAINDDRCTGCDACVAVCPTNVLDLVDNKSRVLRFQDCIQCEACMWACPTSALVMHLEGSEPPPLKVPELDNNFQTMVPGQYLIGEVAGKPLVKNAANLGRSVIEHMLQGGLRSLGQDNPQLVDVVIVGSGPGGLSAALTCVNKGLSYVILEKEQMVASTIARYPKGKFVMAEPYDVRNLSLLPVFDSSKEELIEIWEDLIQRTGLNIKKGEAVEEITKQPDGIFLVRTTVGSYQSQRVVLATGTRGKPRTLGVPGENMPKIHFLLDDPAEFRGKPVIVIGGGDSAVEAAMALADSGAKVVLSYRGRAFNRAAPKNKQAIGNYEAQRRVKIRYQSNVTHFAEKTVTLQMADGSQKTYPNMAAFVLIGSDPPIRWLQKLGVDFVERPHSYSLGKTDDMVLQLAADAVDCPEEAVATAELVLYGQANYQRPPSVSQPEPLAGPRKWLRTATSMFTVSRKLDQPMPLSEFAKRSQTQSRRHSGHGRRDALPQAERTRILRMLRDEGGRIAYEESRIDFQAVPPNPLHEDSPVPEIIAPPRPSGYGSDYSPRAFDGEPKRAVIGGLARARALGPTMSTRDHGPMHEDNFNDEPTRQVDSDDALVHFLRAEQQQQQQHQQQQQQYQQHHRERNDDSVLFEYEHPNDDSFTVDLDPVNPMDEETRVGKYNLPAGDYDMYDDRTDLGYQNPYAAQAGYGQADAHEEATRAVDVQALMQEGTPQHRAQYDDESTRTIDLDGYPDPRAPSLSDVEWDLD